MKITCPKNVTHKEFYTTAHVTEEWVVDGGGDFSHVTEGEAEVVHRPDSQDLFTCCVCGEEGKVVA
jgi:hypothetical protein